MQKQKRVVAIHDISCIGRCSLTVALPIISAAGIETSIIPTAILSTHTAGFTGYTFRDLTDDILPIVEHWRTLDIKFDGIYTGYLGSFAQLDIIYQLFDELKSKDTLIVVDPVMGDNGKLYTAFSNEFPNGMARVVSKANVVVPNITEACLMLGEKYIGCGYTEEYIHNLLVRLADLGPQKVVLTGVQYTDDKIGAATFDKDTEEFGYVYSDKIEGYYHGTGDVFASVLVSSLVNGLSLERSAQIAVNTTVDSIIITKDAGVDPKYGVIFEQALPKFIKDLRM